MEIFYPGIYPWVVGSRATASSADKTYDNMTILQDGYLGCVKSWNDDDTWEHMQYGPFLLLCDFLLWNKFTLLCFLKPFTLEQIDTNKNSPPVNVCPKWSPGVALASILHKSFYLDTDSTKDHHRITLPHHQVIT